MLNNPEPAGNLTNRPFMEGMPVFDAGGEKVGTLSEYNPQAGYLLVQKGWLFRHDVYVPLNAIGNQDANGIYLNMHKNDLQAQNWSAPPASGSALAGTGLAATGAPPLSSSTTGVPPTSAAMPPTSGAAGAGTHATPVQEGDVRIPLREEELVVGKQQQEAGRLHLHKDVIEEQQTATAPVTREKVTVERVPTQGQNVDPGPDTFTEQDIDVPIMGEQLIAGKRGTTSEEVHVHKQPITEQQQVSDTVRKERLSVEGADEQINAQGLSDRPLDTEQPIDRPGY